MRTPVPEVEYRTAESELVRTRVDLEDAERDLVIAAEARDVWAWRAQRPSSEWPTADLESVKSFVLASTAEAGRNAVRERLDSLRWRFNRMTIAPGIEAAAEEAAADESPAVEDRPAAERLLDELRFELRRPREGAPQPKRNDMRGERCRAPACDRRAKDDGLCVVHGERDTCRLDGCSAPAIGPGTCCYHHRGVPADVTVAPARLQRRVDGRCAHDSCPRPARPAPRALCSPCQEAGAFAGVCAVEACMSAPKVGGHCGRHRRFAQAA